MKSLPFILLLWTALSSAQERPVKIEKIPAAIALMRDVKGPYTQHPQILEDLMSYVGSNYRAVGHCFGIYPQDPDAVKSENLHWQVGVRVIDGEPLGYAASASDEAKDPAEFNDLEEMKKRLAA